MNELMQGDARLEIEPMKIRQKIETKIQRLETDLAAAKLALSILEQHPGFEAVQDALVKARIY